MTLVVEISNNLITFFSHQDIFLYQSKKRKVKCADLTETKVYWDLYNTYVQDFYSVQRLRRCIF